MAEWKLWARDVASVRQALIGDYERLSFRSRVSDGGTWSLVLPTAAGGAEYLSRDLRGGIVVERDGAVVFSGLVTDVEREVVAGESDTLTVSGIDDTGQLGRYDILPVASGPPYVAAAYDVATGPAETVLRHYVAVTCANDAQIIRRITGLLAGTSGGLGAAVAWQARFENLLETLQDLAVRGGLVFWVVQDSSDAGILRFVVREPVDRSASVAFSLARRNLIGWTSRESAPEATYVRAGGHGEGTQRTFREAGHSEAINRYGWIEGFLDQRNAETTALLDAAIVTELDKAKPRAAVSLSVIDTAGQQAFVHYGRGDYVSAELDGRRYVGMVREIGVEIEADHHAVVTPLIVLEETDL